jgi:ComF family protein
MASVVWMKLEDWVSLVFPLPERPAGVVLREPFCERCAQPYPAAVSGPFRCANCAGARCWYDQARAAYLSRGAVRDAIHRFKYDRVFWLRRWLGAWLCEGYDRYFAGAGIDAVVPVPLFPRRRRWREFNQAEELAEWLGRERGVPVWRCLRRVRDTETQSTLDRRGRHENLRGAFELASGAAVREASLLMIDDVFTTGATVDACARVLKAEGARRVDVLTVARG